MLLQTPGLRVSLAGAVVFAFGLISLLVLPVVIGLAAILLGGLAVWGGFIMTLFSYYGPASEHHPPAETKR
jgi:hypothetical protein